MSDLPTPSRRYDEKEVGLLLKRAAELQRASPRVPDPSGLTLRELEDIAAEAGLDASMLRQAAAELDSEIRPGAAGIGASLAGAPLRVALERVVDGELDTASCSELLPLVLTAADLAGHASQVGQTFSWTSQDATNVRQMHVLVSSSNGRTRFRVEERYSGLAAAIFGGGLGGIGGGLGAGAGGALAAALGSVALGVGIPVAVFGVTYLGCRAVFRRYVSRRRKVLERLLQELVEQSTPRALGSSPNQ
jgi:hypothetical protein